MEVIGDVRPVECHIETYLAGLAVLLLVNKSHTISPRLTSHTRTSSQPGTNANLPSKNELAVGEQMIPNA
jgi:hypothetical protein